jgi:hypothetical protein
MTKEDVPVWALTPFETCIAQLRDIQRVLTASTAGLTAVAEFPRLHQDLAGFGPKVETRVRSYAKNIWRQGERSKVDLRRDFRLLHASAVVALWGALEVAIEDFLIAWLMNNPSALRIEALQKTKIALAEYEALDREDRMRVLLRELERSVIGKQGVGCFEPLLDTFGLSGSVVKARKQGIYELQQVRNVIVHRGGRADRRFVEACPHWKAKVGEQLKLSGKDCSRYQRAVGDYVLIVAERVAARLGVTANPELERLRSSLRKAR